MDLRQLLVKNRSYRRFEEQEAIPISALQKWITHVSFSPSAANLQPLRFIIIQARGKCSEIFPHLRWAAYLKDWDGPIEGERPAAYVIMLTEGKSGPYTAMDAGIALQTILLGATENGYGGCAIASFDREAVSRILQLPQNCELLLVIALGKPKEKVIIENMQNNDVRYWRDENQVHHVPKRQSQELILQVYNQD